MTDPRVLSLVGDMNASSLWRTIQPAAELERQGYRVHWARKDDSRAGMLMLGYDVLVWPRFSWSAEWLPQARAFVERLHSLGIAVFYEIDDDQFLHLPEHLAGIDPRERDDLVRRGRDSVAALRLCDGATVSVPRLATVARALLGDDRPVAVVPNLIDLAWFNRAQTGQEPRRRGPTVGWVGARRQEADLAPVAAAWRVIAAMFPRVRFVVAGWLPRCLEAAVPPARLTVVPWRPLLESPASWVGIDIACCAVADTPFNACKSSIKALEAGASGCAVVATPTVYREVIRDGDTGLIATTADEWTAALARLVEDGIYRRALARRLAREVDERWSLARHATCWLDAYAWMLADFRERRKAAERPRLYVVGG